MESVLSLNDAKLKKYSYFNSDNKDNPKPLVIVGQTKIRFEEVDSLGIVWHGRYSSYFEDGRTFFGEKYELSYLDMYKSNIIAPIVKLHVDYHNPLRLEENITIKTILNWSESVRLNFEYHIFNSENVLSATGYTVQVLLNLNRDLFLAWPDYMKNFITLWKEGKLYD